MKYRSPIDRDEVGADSIDAAAGASVGGADSGLDEVEGFGPQRMFHVKRRGATLAASVLNLRFLATEMRSSWSRQPTGHVKAISDGAHPAASRCFTWNIVDRQMGRPLRFASVTRRARRASPTITAAGDARVPARAIGDAWVQNSGTGGDPQHSARRSPASRSSRCTRELARPGHDPG